MHSSQPSESWTDIVAFRARDRLTILPMTLVAALASSAWLDPRFSIGWFAANVAFMAASKGICDWIAARPAPDRRHEAVLAAFTFAMTLTYSILPLALVIEGGRIGAVAGTAMVAAVALSSINEIVISRLIGCAALGALFIMACLGVLWRVDALSLAHAMLAVASVCGFFFYVIQTARRRMMSERRMREALIKARDAEAAAAAANTAKSAFLATMSHEIRTPLNGVMGMAQAMAADPLASAQRERLTVIRQSGETLTSILNDVLDLAKIESGQLELEIIPFELEALVGNCQSAFAALAACKGLSLDVEIEPDAQGVYRGDPTRVRQVLLNLISNAVKFTDHGGVTVRASRRDGWVDISVSDTGPGIAPDQFDRLFSKFVQLDASTTRRHGGTGLGLAICRDLCELMGGAVSVNSRVGEGATFTISLPLTPIEPTVGADAAGAADQPELASDLRVLAAEDNAVNQLVLKALLKQFGVEPRVVENGALALEAWESGDWDVILMDVQMPVMDGLTAVREIRSREAQNGRLRTPVIALTANAMVHQIAELRAAGMDAHVSKPIDVGQLLSTLEMVIAAPPANPAEPPAAGLALKR